VLVVVWKAVVVALVARPASFGERWRPQSWWPWRRRSSESAADRSLELLVAEPGSELGQVVPQIVRGADPHPRTSLGRTEDRLPGLRPPRQSGSPASRSPSAMRSRTSWLNASAPVTSEILMPG